MAAQKQMILHKFYIYDSGVELGDELGGLRVREDEGDDKGLYVLAPHLTMQYWIDQGLVGEKPLGELSGEAKGMLAQITRGRSEKPDDRPKRVGRLDKRMQSGAPSLYNQPATVERKKRRKDRQKDRKKGEKQPKRPEPKQAPILGTPAE